MLTTRIKPKISVKPAATTKKRAASVIPFRVTTQNSLPSWLPLYAIHATTARPSNPSKTRGAIRRSTRLGISVSVCSVPVYQNLSGDVTSARQTRQDLAAFVKETEELIRQSAMLAPRGPTGGLSGREPVERR